MTDQSYTAFLFDTSWNLYDDTDTMARYTMFEWMRQNQVLALMLTGAAVFILWELRYVVGIFLAAYLIGATLLPAIDYLARRMPRVLAILLVYLGIVGIIIGIIYPSTQPLLKQAQTFITQFPTYLNDLFGSSFFGNIDLGSIASSFQGRFVGLITATATGVAGIVTAIIVSMYLLYDWYIIHNRIEMALHRHRAIVKEFLDRAAHRLGTWVRGQLVLSAIVGTLVLIALLFIGIEFAVVLGFIAGVFELIPYVGPIMAAVPAVIIGFSHSSATGIAVIIAYVIIQQMENHLLVPLIMKRAVRLHPIVVIFSIIIGFEAMSVPGAFLAVPFVSVLWEGIRVFGHIPEHPKEVPRTPARTHH